MHAALRRRSAAAIDAAHTRLATGLHTLRATALRVVFSWCSLAQWSAHNATPACQLGELGLPAVQETLSLHRPAPEETKTSEENPYSCPALDNEAAAMADWSYRDAHEFALGASLAFTTLLEVLVCIGVFILSLGSLQVDSVTDIWPGAEWREREVYDMYGIRFLNHPDLRRILMWEEFPGHPLRKDFPLRGRGEREHYKTLDRESR